MFEKLIEINSRPEPFQFYTADDLWTDAHTAKKMLEYHLNPSVDAASRNPEFIDRSVEWIVSRFHLDSRSEVADFGCGPGLYASRLAERGVSVTGIDFSANSLDYARNEAAGQKLEIDYICCNYLEFESSRRFDLIMMIMCDFCALSPVQRRTILGKFHEFLKPDGAILLDVHTAARFDQLEESATYELNQLNGFWSPEDYYCFVNTLKYGKEKVVLDKYTIVEKSRERVVYNWLQHFSPETLRTELEQNGFRVEALYSDVAGTPLADDAAEIAAVAVKD